MRRPVGVVTAPLLTALLACGETPDPTALAASHVHAASPAPASSSSVPGRQILMLDACDPESFNEAFGEEICTPANPHRRGGISFSTFIDLLEKHQRVEAWRFSPDVIRVTREVTMSVPNLGGIPHSFTEVEEFGGGFVELLNMLSGNPVPAPECLDFETMRLIPPGEADEVTFTPGEHKKYMCCIHPWMRAVSM